jgi:hypothetical protein
MRYISLFLILIFVFFSNKSYSQQTFIHKEAGVQLVIPPGWFYESEDNNITFYPEDKDLVVSITIHEMNNVESIIDSLISDLTKLYTSVDLTNPKEDNIHGMKGWNFYGTAKNEEEDLMIQYGLYLTPLNKILELGVVASGDIFEKYKKDIKSIQDGLKPLEK